MNRRVFGELECVSKQSWICPVRCKDHQCLGHRWWNLKETLTTDFCLSQSSCGEPVMRSHCGAHTTMGWENRQVSGSRRPLRWGGKTVGDDRGVTLAIHPLQFLSIQASGVCTPLHSIFTKGSLPFLHTRGKPSGEDNNNDNGGSLPPNKKGRWKPADCKEAQRWMINNPHSIYPAVKTKTKTPNSGENKNINK